MKIANEIDKYSDFLSFHTPGHKGLLDKRDTTELEDLFPLDYIEKAQCECAKFYGLKYLRFLYCGSSMGIKASIIASDGDILAMSNSHRAVAQGTALNKVNLFTLENQVKDGLAIPPTALQVENGLNKYKSVKAFLLMYPDYYGLCSKDFMDIIDVVKSKGKLLIVDMAHGAHFNSRPDIFPVSLTKYADFINLSAHKTLRAYTQTAYLGCNNDDYIDALDIALENLGSSSPSYLFYNQLYEAVKFEQTNKAHYDELLVAINELKVKIKCVKNDDPFRVVVDGKAFGLTGHELYTKLVDRKIIAEKYDDRYVVFIVTLSDSVENIKILAKELVSIYER